MARASTTARPTVPAPGRIPVALTINGVATQLEVAPWTTLLDALRDHLDLTGTKKGCDHGEREAGIDPPSVHQHRTGAALAVIAALLGAGQVEMVAQRIE